MSTDLMITVAVLTLSDRSAKGDREDSGGSLIRDTVQKINGTVLHHDILPDEKDLIKQKLIQYARTVDLILTTGGTGLSPRDVTPEATREIIDREVPGIAEAMRLEGLKKTDRAMLSRAIAGVRGTCLIINLPGSPKAVREGLTAILDVIPHAVEKIKGDPSECATQ